MLDFFDFLAGEKLYLPNEETAQLEKQQIYFSFVSENLLSPSQAKENKSPAYKPVKIVGQQATSAGRAQEAGNRNKIKGEKKKEN